MPIKPKNRFKHTAEIDAWRYNYKASVLGEVVTPNEICIIWGKARLTVDRAIEARKLESRLTITAGSVLVTVRSCIALWGEIPEGIFPKNNASGTQLSLFELEKIAEKHAPHNLHSERIHKRDRSN